MGNVNSGLVSNNSQLLAQRKWRRW